jgi:hypothetical protein
MHAAVLRQRNAAQSKLARAYGFRVCGQREASQQAG